MKYEVKNKYYSMKRAYERLKAINTDNGNTISLNGAQDETEEFFNQCHHLKDWLIKDDTNTLTKNEVENFVNNNKSLCLAADICNSFKHAGLSKNPRSGKVLAGANNHINLQLKDGQFVATASREFNINGDRCDALSLATECLEAWDKYLQQNQIEV